VGLPAGGACSGTVRGELAVHFDREEEPVTELDATTGALVHVFRAPRTYGFDSPFGIASDGTDVWVANSADQTITGFPA
jgi:hypothetical protein